MPANVLIDIGLVDDLAKGGRRSQRSPPPKTPINASAAAEISVAKLRLGPCSVDETANQDRGAIRIVG